MSAHLGIDLLEESRLWIGAEPRSAAAAERDSGMGEVVVLGIGLRRSRDLGEDYSGLKGDVGIDPVGRDSRAGKALTPEADKLLYDLLAFGIRVGRRMILAKAAMGERMIAQSAPGVEVLAD